MGSKEIKIEPRGSALIPFLVFIVVYLGVAIVLQLQGVEMAFYQMPAPIAVLVGIIVAFIMFKGTLNDKFDQFVKGCGNSNIITMCCIYLLAGGFAGVAKAMGGVEATANLGLSIIPPQFITAGLFFIAAFLSLATGTSVGTIGAIGAIAVEVATKANLNMVLVMGAVIGGSMFGDNLSMISDTTIAATRTQGCEMRDKFQVNLLIALPAAILTFVLLLLLGQPEVIVPLEALEFSMIKIVPYILILVLSLSGLNVFVTLMTGIIVAIVIGVATGDLTLMASVQSVYGGFTGMFEIFLLSMLTGGLSEMVTQNGGLHWALMKIQAMVKGRRTAEIGIAGLVSIADVATANNTVAIVITGSIAKGISDEYHVDPRRSASLLDTWSCVFQGIVPYGAQILVGCGLTAGLVNPFQLFSTLWYPYLLGVFALISIFIPYADGYIKKNPWDWSKNKASISK